MVREGDVARQSSQDGRRVDLCVRIRLVLESLLKSHRNIASFRLTRINVLHEEIVLGCLPEKKSLPLAVRHDFIDELPLCVCTNLSKSLSIVHRAEHAACFRGQPDLLECRLPDNPRVNVDEATLLGLAELGKRLQ